tara:strand:+ start:947 stop:2041 length:1095 start_codon:yes stop_codon:yes gene_type:complete
MEGLKLEDLNFEDNGEVFDVFKTKEENKSDVVNIEVPNVDETKTPDSEKKEVSSESVASGDDNKNQGQADKANDKSGANSSSPTLNDDEKLYSTLATHLITKGALSDLDPLTVKSVDDLNEAIEKEAEKRLGSREKAISEAIKAGAPASAVTEIVDNISQLQAITDADIQGDPSLVKNLIMQDFLNKGYNQDRASIMTERSIAAGTGNEDAKFALTGLISSEQARHESVLTTAKQEEAESLNKIKTILSGGEGGVKDINLTESQQLEVYDQMTTDVGGRRSRLIEYQQENPIESRVKLETLFYLTKEFTDFSIFGEKAVKKNANDLTSLLRGASFTEEGKIQTEVNDSQSSFNVKNFTDNFDIA